MYSWQFKEDKSRDFGIHEIKRGDDPFTVIITQFSKVGHKQLFSDLFYSDDWDEGRSDIPSNDVKFCIKLWNHLGLDKEHGPFHPRHIEHSLDRSPLVYRNTLENVMNIKYGCGHTQFVTNVIESSSPHVVKLDISFQDSEETIFEKISKGLNAKEHHAQNRAPKVVLVDNTGCDTDEDNTGCSTDEDDLFD